MKIIDRPLYTERIKPYIGKSIIKVLTGQRRVGKSYILKKIAEDIKAVDPTANIIEINLEDFSFAHVTTADALFREINDRSVSDAKSFVFLDEIQEVEDFDKVLRSLALSPDYDIYVTGSNSKMLSAEMASRLAGRSIEFHIHPLSYSEFLAFHRLEDSDEAVMTFLRYGGLPYLINLSDKETWAEYIENVTDAIVYRDVVARHSLRSADFLSRLMLFLADNIGQLFTAKRIADYIKSQRISANVTTVQSYVSYIEEAFIVNRARRWDIEGKRFFEIGEKFFFEDTGIRNSIVGFRPHDLGAVLENAVYNHLIINRYNVKIGNIGNKEIDFVAEKNGEFKYVQVALTILDADTAEREFGNLEQISDNYEKILVTLNDTFPNTRNGIKTMNLREFLLT
ncbi:MAG: ATP-binding protein [Muribaculaceae bacterium]|nr:ATP-binding protein [Muribaculaceae bacterium]